MRSRFLTIEKKRGAKYWKEVGKDKCKHGGKRLRRKANKERGRTEKRRNKYSGRQQGWNFKGKRNGKIT